MQQYQVLSFISIDLPIVENLSFIFFICNFIEIHSYGGSFHFHRRIIVSLTVVAIDAEMTEIGDQDLGYVTLNLAFLSFSLPELLES